MVSALPQSIRVGVLGATGIAGAEVVSRLDAHPSAVLGFATSRSRAGGFLDATEPSAPPVRLVDPAEVDLGSVDVVFSCLPHGASAESVEAARSAGARVVDLSGDLRLRDEDVHDATYGSPRSASIAGEAVYGLTECFRPALVGATVVANPGCYPTCVGLPLRPLAEAGILAGPVVIHAQSGVSGAGRIASDRTHFCAAADDVRPYGLGREHRHVPEIEQLLGEGLAAGEIVFCPHLVPIDRGMLATVVLGTTEADAPAVHARLAAVYAGEPFIDVRPFGEPARIRAVSRSNRVSIGVHDGGRPDRVIVTSAIDNVVKGAAGQAIQNMNVMFGLPETAGLGRPVGAREATPTTTATGIASTHATANSVVPTGLPAEVSS